MNFECHGNTPTNDIVMALHFFSKVTLMEEMCLSGDLSWYGWSDLIASLCVGV